MANSTSHAEELSRQETADRLRQLADTIDGDGVADVQVGNKAVRLSPGASLDFEIEVTEVSRRLRSDRETVRVDLGWTPE